MQYISFPGLGIGPFHIDKVAFTVFGRDVAWYGILITFGMILCVLYANYIATHREELKSDDVVDLAFYVIIFGVLGARLYYVLFELDAYIVTSGTFLQNVAQSFVRIISIWNGGLAIYGGVLAGLLTAYLFARHRKIPFLKLFDILGATVLIGQIIGRWGNFVNMEAHGGETTLPWRMGLLTSYSGTIPADGVWDRAIYVHPTFLYESLWNLIGFCILNALYKKKKYDGEIFGGYCIWYGFGRMLIEGLRTDSLMLGPIRISQLVGALSCVFGVIFCLIRAKQTKKVTAAAEEYTAVYEKTNDIMAEDAEKDGTKDARNAVQVDTEKDADRADADSKSENHTAESTEPDAAEERENGTDH